MRCGAKKLALGGELVVEYASLIDKNISFFSRFCDEHHGRRRRARLRVQHGLPPNRKREPAKRRHDKAIKQCSPTLNLLDRARVAAPPSMPRRRGHVSTLALLATLALTNAQRGATPSGHALLLGTQRTGTTWAMAEKRIEAIERQTAKVLAREEKKDQEYVSSFLAQLRAKAIESMHALLEAEADDDDA